MEITLDEIKAQHSKLAEMIKAFEAQTPTLFLLREASIELRPGERYAGVLLDDDGKVAHHLILLPGEAEDVTWGKARTWATELGGELPSRREQSLLFANLKGEFEGAWYWSGEQSSEGFAWYQYFDYGGQRYGSKDDEFRARAVRRVDA